jgi:hypothetical protein
LIGALAFQIFFEHFPELRLPVKKVVLEYYSLLLVVVTSSFCVIPSYANSDWSHLER